MGDDYHLIDDTFFMPAPEEEKEDHEAPQKFGLGNNTKRQCRRTCCGAAAFLLMLIALFLFLGVPFLIRDKMSGIELELGIVSTSN